MKQIYLTAGVRVKFLVYSIEYFNVVLFDTSSPLRYIYILFHYIYLTATVFFQILKNMILFLLVFIVYYT